MSNLIPPGRYLARATSSRFDTIQTTGSELIRVNFQITDGEYQGRIVRWDGFFTEKAEEKTKKALATMGFAPASQADWLTLCEEHADASSIFPAEVQLKLEHKPGNNGQTYLEVAYIDPPGGPGASRNPVDVQQKKAFAARMMAGSKPAPAPQPARGSGPGGSTVGQRTSSQQAREQRAAQGGGPKGGASTPPDDRFDGPDEIPF